MAYADYSGGSLMEKVPGGGIMGGMNRPRLDPNNPGQYITAGQWNQQQLGGAQPQPPSQGPQPMPTNTRAQALQSVQQAYQRSPGDMGFLNQLLQQSSSPVSASDPMLAPAFAAGRVADQRNIDRQRAALAEQLGGAGLSSSGAMQNKVLGIQQRVGENQALRESGQMLDEGNAKRNALLQALGLDQSRYMGDNDLGYRLAALEAQLNQNAVNPFF